MTTKRIACIVLFVLLLVSTTAHAVSDEPIYFIPVLTNSMDLSVADWTDDSQGRSLFSVLMICDLALELENSDTFDSSQNSYVAADGDMIELYIHGTANKDYLIVYQPELDIAAYQIRDYTDDNIVYAGLEISCEGSVYRNSKTEMSSIAKQFSAAMEE